MYAFFTNIPTPQKVPLLNALNEALNNRLVVFFFAEEVEKRKGWSHSLKEARFDYHFLESRRFDINHPVDPGYIFLPSRLPSMKQFKRIVVSGGISPMEVGIVLKAMGEGTEFVVWTGAVSLRGAYTFLMPIRYILRKFIYSRARAVVVPNTLAREHALRMGARRVEIAYTSFDLSKFEWERKHKGTFLRILFIGRLVKVKRIFDLLKAVSSIDNYRLTIVGKGPLEKEILRAIHELGIDRYTALLGEVPYEQIPEIYRQHDLLILPSEMEVHGFVIMESLLSSTPVISTNMVGARDFVIPRAIYPVGHIEELRKRIEWMRNPENRNRAVEYGKRLIREKATPERWAEVFRRVLLE